MKDLLQWTETEKRILNLLINKDKTKITVINKTSLPILANLLTDYENVDWFVYMDCMVEKGGGSKTEICYRRVFVRDAVRELTVIWRNWSLTTHIKLRLLKYLIFPVFLHVLKPGPLELMMIKKGLMSLKCNYRRLLNVMGGKKNHFIHHKRTECPKAVIFKVWTVKIQNKLWTSLNISSNSNKVTIRKRSFSIQQKMDIDHIEDAQVMDISVKGKAHRTLEKTTNLRSGRFYLVEDCQSCCLIGHNVQIWKTA